MNKIESKNTIEYCDENNISDVECWYKSTSNNDSDITDFCVLDDIKVSANGVDITRNDVE